MSRAIHVTAGNHSGPRKNRGLDQFATPACAIEALLTKEPLPHHILEPCAGDGDIVRVLRTHGHQVTGYDLAKDGIDFLQQRQAPPGAGAIVTNPPFTLAADFVHHGLALVPKVMVLERIQWLEAGPRTGRVELFGRGKLARIWFFRDRVPRMHRADWTGKRASASMTLAWFVFEADHAGKPDFDWITWR